MSPAARLVFAFSLALSLTALGCGGAKASGAGANGPAGDGADDSHDAADPVDPVEARCADGRCFACGDGFCPIGFSCLDSSAGGPSCIWTPECQDAASCACVQPSLDSSCSCEETGSAVHVRCP